MSKTNLDRIKTLMEHASADADLCMMVNRLIESAPQNEQLDLFVYFMKNLKNTDSDESMNIPSMIEAEKIVKYSKKSIKFLDDFINELYRRQVSEEEFYRELWEFISTDYHFNCAEARGVAMFNCLKMKKVPYVLLDVSKALKMDNEEFGALMEEVFNSEYMKKIKDIEAFGFEQKTEKMSMLLNVIDSCADEKMRVLLFMSVVGAHVKKEMNDLMRSALLSDD